MNNDQIFSLVRQYAMLSAGALGSWLVAKGYMSSEQWQAIVGFVTVTLIPIMVANYTSIKAHSAAGKLASVATIPDVVAVRMAPTVAGKALADAVTSSKVAA